MVKIIIKILRFIYKQRIIAQAGEIGKGIKVNRWSSVTRNTFLGDNVNLNGISIVGRGRVAIGNNFHSGNNCLLISEIHNYDNGTAIPYDKTYILKNIIIEDNVWIGSRVIMVTSS